MSHVTVVCDRFLTCAPLNSLASKSAAVADGPSAFWGTGSGTSAARALTARFKIALTGTPMENHYGEFYSLVDLLVPGSLGRIEDFRKTFVNTVFG